MVKQRKRLSRGAKEKKAKTMLKDGFTWAEIKAEIAIGNDTLTRLSKALKVQNQVEIQLKTQDEERKVALVKKYDEISPQIEALSQETQNLQIQAGNLEQQFEKMIGTKVRVTTKALQYVEMQLEAGVIDADKLAYTVLKEGK